MADPNTDPISVSQNVQVNAPDTTDFASSSTSDDAAVTNWNNLGISDTTQAEQFVSEEWNAWFAQGHTAAQEQKGASPFNGFKLPAGEAGDFWSLYTNIESYAANAGWKNLASPTMILKLLGEGANTWDTYQLYSTLSAYNGTTKSEPWALVGQNQTDFNKYKIQNQGALEQQFGGKYTDSQVVESIRNPLQSFQAQGSAFGQEAPFVSAQPAQNLGHQSSVR